MLLKLIINRVRGVLMEPRREFVSILNENKSRRAILTQYIIPFLTLFFVTTFFGSVIFAKYISSYSGYFGNLVWFRLYFK